MTSVLFHAVKMGRRLPYDSVLVASVDGFTVAWRARQGWTCDCPAPDDAACPHVEAVNALLHPDIRARMTEHTTRGTHS